MSFSQSIEAMYKKLPQEDIEANNEKAFDFSSAFSYKSVFTYNNLNLEDEVPERRNTLIENLCHHLVVALSCIVLVATSPITIWLSVKFLQPWERMLLFRLGRYEGIKGPGTVIIIPWLDKITRVDIRTRAFSILPQQLIMGDGAIIDISASVIYRISNPQKFIMSVYDYQSAIRSLGKTLLLNCLTNMYYEDIEKDKSCVAEKIRFNLNEACVKWGIEINKVELSAVTLLKPPENNTGLRPLMKSLGLYTEDEMNFDAFKTSPSDLVPQTQIGIFLHKLIQSNKTPSVDGVFKLIISNSTPEIYYIVAFKESHRLFEGEHPELQPDVTVETASEDFFDIFNGSLPPLQAYLNGKLKVDGDLRKLMYLESIATRSFENGSIFTL